MLPSCSLRRGGRFDAEAQSRLRDKKLIENSGSVRYVRGLERRRVFLRYRSFWGGEVQSKG